MFYGMEGWDPNHNEFVLGTPLFARKSSGPIAYDTITCIYVLDVLPTREEQNTVVRKVVELLKPPVEDGFAYFAVRRDVPEDRMVVLPWKCLVESRGFAIYEVFK